MNTEYTEITDGFCDRIYSQNTGHKIYDKGSEIVNQPKTAKEHELCEKIKNQEIPSNIFRLEKTFQKKVPTCNALSGYLGKTVKECCIEDAFNNGFCQSILLDMVEKLGKTFNLIAEDVGHKDNFLSIESALRTAEKLGLKGKNRAFFAVYALSVGQMGVKNTTTMYDDIFGRKGQEERIKYSNMIDELLRKTDLQGFFLVDLFNEVREQVQQFKIYKTEEQARFLFSEIEKRENERPHQFIPSAKPT